MTTNKYNLDDNFQAKTDGVVLNIKVMYDIPSDKLTVDYALRNDVTSEDLLQRMSEQVEHALRAKSAYYGVAMQVLEENAGLEKLTACGCSECPA